MRWVMGVCLAMVMGFAVGCVPSWVQSRYEPRPGQALTVTKAVAVETEYGVVRLVPGDWVVRPRLEDKMSEVK
jgi:hypothetical protein